jgi:hypothetical protein
MAASSSQVASTAVTSSEHAPAANHALSVAPSTDAAKLSADGDKSIDNAARLTSGRKFVGVPTADNAVAEDSTGEDDDGASEMMVVAEILFLEAFLASNEPNAALCLVSPAAITSGCSDDSDADVVDSDTDASEDPLETTVRSPAQTAAIYACGHCRVSVVNRLELWQCPTCGIRSCCATCANLVHRTDLCVEIAATIDRLLQRISVPHV